MGDATNSYALRKQTSASKLPPGEEETEASYMAKYPQTFFTCERGNLKFVNFVVEWPKAFLSFVYIFSIFCCIMLASFAWGENPVTDDSHEYDLNDIRSIKYDSFILAIEDVEGEYASFLAEQPDAQGPLLQSEVKDNLWWIFESNTDDLLTPAGIGLVREAVELILSDSEWESKWCRLVYDFNDPTNKAAASCEQPLSLDRIYYASSWDSAVTASIIEDLKDQDTVDAYNVLSLCIDFGLFCTNAEEFKNENGANLAIYNSVVSLSGKIDSVIELWDGAGTLNPNMAEVTEFCAYMKLLFSRRARIDYYFDKAFSLTNLKSKYSRSLIFFGGPVAGFQDVEEEETRDGGRSGAENDARKDWILDNLFDDMEIIAAEGYNSAARAYYFMGALFFDVIILVLLNDMLMAFISITLVFIYMRIMIGSWFLAIVGLCEIILSIPLAWLIFAGVFQIQYFPFLNAMCLFIVAAIGADDIFVFMDAYRQSSHKGQFINRDLQTRLSYVYRRAGLAMMITSATTCSAFLCTTFSPLAGTTSFGIFASLVILMDYALVMSMYCTAVVIFHNYFDRKAACKIGLLNCCDCEPASLRAENKTTTERAFREEIGDDEDVDKVSLFFRNTFAPFILNKTNRIVIGAVLGIWICIATWQMTLLEPTQTAEEFLNSDHPLQKSITILQNQFPVANNDIGAWMHFVWGVDDVDRDGVNQLANPDYIGKVNYVKDWELTEECQLSLVEICSELETKASTPEYSAHVKTDETGLGSVKCVMNEVKDWTNEVLGTPGCPWNPTSFVFPIPVADQKDAMEVFWEEESCKQAYAGEDLTSVYEDQFGFNGDRVKYIALSVESSALDPFSQQSEEVFKVEYDFFLKLLDDYNSRFSDKCGKAIFTDTDQKFIFMNKQKIYRESAISGATIGVAIAFGVIFVSTRILVVAAAATFSILCVLISVVGAVTMIGWKLSADTAILITILAGFSVDYVVHLAHAFVEAPGDTERKLKDAFGDMGVSVMSGMITSVVASLPLFNCQLQFFAKFGTFLCMTIAFSWVFANFGFMSLMASVTLPKKIGSTT